ncbi:MAG: efflux RND transporter periplasmic adaptor subunit [Chitinophagia bacterium]|nr:efflux RND transporter periplasmic adaptor subunit [Chitinophagia bacterium]
MKGVNLIASMAISILLISCSHPAEQQEEEMEFVVSSPLQTDTTIYKEYVAQIRSANHIELRSQEKGYLEKIFVDEGQFVKKGQLMFKLTPVIYQAEVDKAKAEVEAAEIEFTNAKTLAGKNIISASEVALIRAKLNQAKATLSLAQAHLNFTEIRAPFNGLMDRFYTRLGSLVDEGELLTNLSDNSKMWVYFNVSEAEYLDYDFNNETGNIAFRAGFQNPKGVLRHGETGNILVPINLKDAIIIPQKSTFDILDRKYVYIVDANNVLQSREVTVAHELPHLYVIASGLQASDKILSEGFGKVKNNEKINYKFVPIKKQLEEIKKLHAE